MWVLFAMCAVYGFVLGACLASFVAVVAERVPQKRSIRGRSRCSCGRQLRWFENVPVVGWIRVRGVARCCGARIPRRLLDAELLLGTWGSVLGWSLGVLLVAGEPSTGAVALSGAGLLGGCLVLLHWLWPRS